MHAEITRLDLRLRRRSVVAVSAGVAGYAVLIVALYPSFRHDPTLEQLTRANPTLGALFGATGSLTTPDGWMNANLYANFAPLIALFLTVGYAAWSIAGQDEDGMLAVVTTQPLTRDRVLAEKILALAALSLPVPLAAAAATLLGRMFDVDLPLDGLLASTALLALMAFDLGLLALLVGTLTGRRGTALGASGAVAAVAYVISSLAPVVGWVHHLRYLSPFYWSVGADQLRNGSDLLGTCLLVLTGLALALGARTAFRRLDLH